MIVFIILQTCLQKADNVCKIKFAQTYKHLKDKLFLDSCLSLT